MLNGSYMKAFALKENLEPDAERGNTNKLLIQTSRPKNLQKNISDIEKHQQFMMINKWKKTVYSPYKRKNKFKKIYIYIFSIIC